METESQKHLEELKRHRGQFFLHPQDIRHMLQVPDDVSIWHIRWDEQALAFRVSVVSDRFPEVADFAEPPLFGTKRTWHTKSERMTVEFVDDPGSFPTVEIVED
jgi:hypothetical protein